MIQVNFGSEPVAAHLDEATQKIQIHLLQQNGQDIPLEDLQKVIVGWLEGSIEQLVEDVVFHCVEGDERRAFNRSEFEELINKVAKRNAA